MKKIIALTDYKNCFGSKHFDQPYRSGMDKELLKKSFHENSFEIEFISFSDISNSSAPFNTEAYYIYTSSEDINYFYKSYIEDVILYLEQFGCKVIPKYPYLRANNNKVFMEFLLKSKNRESSFIPSYAFGTKEEMDLFQNEFSFPMIVKTSEGAGSSGVFKADDIDSLKRIVSKIASTKNIRDDYKEIGRTYKHKGYIKESSYRKKFIVQKMIPGLKNDWKVYFFMNRLYIFYRPVFKENIFKASGGGYNNYIYGNEAPIPNGIFDFVHKTVCSFDIPHASLDIGFDGKKFYLFEIQFLYFGTAGIPYSKGYFKKSSDKYCFIEEKLSIEKVYADAISEYINLYNG